MALTRSKSLLPPPGIYKLDGGQWKEVTTKQGKEQIHWAHELTDLDGREHALSLYATEQQYASIGKNGGLTNPEGGDVSIPSGFAAGMFMDTLEDKGFSARKLKDVDANPGCADGTWVRIDHLASDKSDANGKPYVNAIVTEVFEGKPKGGQGGGKSTGSKTTKAVADDDDDDDKGGGTSNDDTPEELDASDDEIEAAVGYVQEVLADPDTYVKNFDAEENDGGVTLQQANTSAFKHFKGKGAMKGAVAKLVADPAFHKLKADDGGWVYDADNDVISPAKKKKGKK